MKKTYAGSRRRGAVRCEAHVDSGKGTLNRSICAEASTRDRCGCGS